ncbi:MAG: hypothetical protein AB7O56_10840 [Bauldia sp.]
MKLPSLVAAMATLPLLATSALGQAREDHYDPGQFLIEGVLAYCAETETVVRNSGELIVRADPFTIAINGPAFDALPPGVRLFTYYHTCAFGFYQDPVRADDIAARTGVEQRWLSVPDVELICTTTTLADAGWTVAPDAARCEAIYATMRQALAP